MFNDLFPFHHMTYEDRMKRLYEFLLQMGLVVVPIPSKEDPTIVNYLNVSVSLPNQRGCK